MAEQDDEELKNEINQKYDELYFENYISKILHESLTVSEVLNLYYSFDFYKKQERIALKNCGVIDPENIDEYIAFDGYKALEKVLGVDLPDEIINPIIDGVKAQLTAEKLGDAADFLKKLF